MFQTYFHHAVSISGCLTSNYLDNHFGCIAHFTLFTEFSTPFVNMRWLLAFHKLSRSRIYMINGIMMTLAFFFARIVYYIYFEYATLFGTGSIYPSYWETYDQDKVTLTQFAIFLLTLLAVLNSFWFYKMMMGLLKFLKKGKK